MSEEGDLAPHCTGISTEIRCICQKIIAAVDGFQKGEFGLAQSRGKLEVRGHEYGCYDICGLPAQDGEDNTVWIHRDDDAVIVYFRFER